MLNKIELKKLGIKLPSTVKILDDNTYILYKDIDGKMYRDMILNVHFI